MGRTHEYLPHASVSRPVETRLYALKATQSHHSKNKNFSLHEIYLLQLCAF
jgi:hypothetical protein